jgi:hypothetical protein
MAEADDEKWAEICRVDRARSAESGKHWVGISDQVETLRRALDNHRGADIALRILLMYGDETKQQLIGSLVRGIAVTNVNIHLYRTVVKSISRRWVLGKFEEVAESYLQDAVDEEPYRRLAEFYGEFDDEMLRRLMLRAEESANAEVREVADDFKAYLK